MASLGKSLSIPLNMVILMWLAFVIQVWLGINLAVLGILPRQPLSLLGIFTAPLVHGSFFHLISNTFPILVLGGVLFYFYSRVARQVFSICYFASSALVWLFARPSFHIGASGVIYGLAFFIIFIGFIRKDLKSTIISVIIVLLYGGLFYGIFPTEEHISWEAHLMGALVGIASAIYYSGKRKLGNGI